MRRNIDREENRDNRDNRDRSGNKYSGVFRPSHEIPRQTELDESGVAKRYSFLVKAAGSPNRRPLTSKNTNGVTSDPIKVEDSRKHQPYDRNDQNIDKKYLSMTPTNARKEMSGKKQATAGKAEDIISQFGGPASQIPVSRFHHKTNSSKLQIKPEGKPEVRRLDYGQKYDKFEKYEKYEGRTPVRREEIGRKSIHEFELEPKKQQPPPPPQQQKYFEYIMRYSYRSKKGFIPNTQKFNQDAYIVSPNLSKKSYQHYFGICDGHGTNGHHVSTFIKTQLTHLLSTHPNLPSNPSDNLYKAYKCTVDKLLNQSKIDLSYSGSTVIGCYLIHDKLYCCNVGDSRAVVGRKQGKNWRAIAVSNDHKPSVQAERERILRGKGRVEAFRDAEGREVGPLRVWLRDANGPGLAMTRSFGDLVAASVGVCWEPEIIEHTMTQNDRIIIVASDGVWEFLENDDVINKLAPYYESNKIEQACDFLLEYANASWNKQCTIIDDISFVLIFMNYSS